MKSKNDTSTDHRHTILNQFTRQAGAFAAMRAHSNESAFELLFQMARFGLEDTVLDVGCGPGLVACAVAPKVAKVVGIDLTPAMIEKARDLQKQRGLINLDWQVGDVQAMPFGNESFSCVFSRYIFHHLRNTQIVFDEMCRVTQTGGRVVVVDVTPEKERRAAYDQMEKLRDPSHTSAMTLDEMVGLGDKAGLKRPQTKQYGLEVDLRELLDASFPNAAKREDLYRMFELDLGKDRLGFEVCQVDGSIHIRFPTTIAVWQK